MHDGGGGFGGGHMGGGHMGGGHVGSGHVGNPAAHHHHGSHGPPGMAPASPGYIPGAKRGPGDPAAGVSRFVPTIALVALVAFLFVVVFVVH